MSFKFSDLTLGSIILGSGMFARGSGLRQWDKAVHCCHKEKIEEVHTLNTSGAQLSTSV